MFLQEFSSCEDDSEHLTQLIREGSESQHETFENNNLLVVYTFPQMFVHKRERSV